MGAFSTGGGDVFVSIGSGARAGGGISARLVAGEKVGFAGATATGGGEGFVSFVITTGAGGGASGRGVTGGTALLFTGGGVERGGAAGRGRGGLGMCSGPSVEFTA